MRVKESFTDKPLHQQNMIVKTQLIDMEWRLFKEWQRVIPEEIFETLNSTLIKRAAKEGIEIKNVKIL